MIYLLFYKDKETGKFHELEEYTTLEEAQEAQQKIIANGYETYIAMAIPD